MDWQTPPRPSSAGRALGSRWQANHTQWPPQTREPHGSVLDPKRTMSTCSPRGPISRRATRAHSQSLSSRPFEPASEPRRANPSAYTDAFLYSDKGTHPAQLAKLGGPDWPVAFGPLGAARSAGSAEDVKPKPQGSGAASSLQLATNYL